MKTNDSIAVASGPPTFSCATHPPRYAAISRAISAAGGFQKSPDACAAASGPAELKDRPDVMNKSEATAWRDRKSTRLNSSHLVISYAVFCLKKKTKTYEQ